MPSIFELVTSQSIVAYWEELAQDREPYLGDELFPARKKLGLKLDWIKGSKGLPVVLKPSAFDAAAVPRERIGFDKLTSQMPFFKESTYIDEELRQELNMVLETGNQAYIDSVMNRVFNDETNLLEGAAAQRERIRMQALTTGMLAIAANGQNYNYDYGMPESHKVTAGTSWSDPTANIVDDIRTWMDLIEDDTGVRPTRSVLSRKTWNYLLHNEVIKKSIFVLSNGQATLNDAALRSYLDEQLGMSFAIYNKRYKDEKGVVHKYMPDDTLVAMPEGPLGNSWFGTTPEESDLMGGNAANVSITDTGVAVTTMRKTDPVNVETKVSQIFLPSFEQIDHIFIADVIA